jgi:hypothetical protein
MTENVNPLPKSKNTLLPLLIILFLVSYGIMSLLVVEQGRTIDAQRNLIRSLFSDSTELSSMKGRIVQDRNERAAQANAQSHSEASPEAQAQAQASARDNARNEHKKVGKPAPLLPPQDASDTTDVRRALISI